MHLVETDGKKRIVQIMAYSSRTHQFIFIDDHEMNGKIPKCMSKLTSDYEIRYDSV